MALPYIFAASFDTGDNSQWDSETDVSGALDFPHYTELSRAPTGAAPYRGAYCMRIVAPANTADHTLTAGAINISANTTAWHRFALFISKDFAATADDIFNIYEIQATGTVETAISLQIIAATDVVSIGIGETEASSFPSTLAKGQWHVIELQTHIDAGAGNDGISTLYVNGDQIQQLTSLDQGAITDGVLGTQNTLATTDTGFLLFDDFAVDDTRVGVTDRWALSRVLSSDSFAFIGKGRVENMTIIDGGSGDVSVDLYDTDVYSSSLTPVWSSATVTADTDVYFTDLDINFRRGCLVNFGGTLPAASVQMSHLSVFGSNGSIRLHGFKRGGTEPI